MADSIGVMKNGQMIEYGKDQELIEKQGEYYTLFTKQPSSYIASS